MANNKGSKQVSKMEQIARMFNVKFYERFKIDEDDIDYEYYFTPNGLYSIINDIHKLDPNNLQRLLTNSDLTINVVNFIPEPDEEFYYVNAFGGISHLKFDPNKLYHLFLVSSGNCFSSKEIGEKYSTEIHNDISILKLDILNQNKVNYRWGDGLDEKYDYINDDNDIEENLIEL